MTSDDALNLVEDLLTRAAANAAAGGHDHVAHAIQYLQGAVKIAWPAIWAAEQTAIRSAAGPGGVLTVALGALVTREPWLKPVVAAVLAQLTRFLPSV